jgi:hypothetical protein
MLPPIHYYHYWRYGLDSKTKGHTDEQDEQSPESHEEYVKDDLDQDNVTHMGEWRKGHSGTKSGERDGDRHLGATEDEVVPIIPPMSGPADVVGEHNENAQGNETGDTDIGEETVDPRDHLTPG